MPMYGQLVIGAPGSGKSTYCTALCDLLRVLKRPFLCINLDPANDVLPYMCDIDIRELIRVEDVMERLNLGPNGALRYCMQTLKKNINWLHERIKDKEFYLIFDLPGQLELYSGDDCISDIIKTIQKWDFRLVAIHLNESIYCYDAGKFISVVLSSLIVMINLEVAQINVLSKVDLINDDLQYNFEFFQNLPDMKRLAELLQDDEVLGRYKTMNEELCSVIDDYNLVSFIPISVNDKEKLMTLLKAADNANGYSLIASQDLRNIVMKNTRRLH